MFNSQRSQLLLLTILPTVETACAAPEQQEAQRAVLNLSSPVPDLMAMYGKAHHEKHIQCTACGNQGHLAEKCWSVVGYPKNPSFNLQDNPSTQSLEYTLSLSGQTLLSRK